MAETRPENPLTESMNNFWMHLPGGPYRLEDFNPDDSTSVGTKIIHDKYSQYLDQPERTWPPELADGIRECKTRLAVHKEMDEVLAKNPELAKIVDKLERKPYEITNNYETVRPLWLKLREKFTQLDLKE